MGETVQLTEHILAVRVGEGDPRAMLGEFRRTAVLVPRNEAGVLAGMSGGIQWIYAFTDEERLARFAAARGAPPDAEVPYHVLLGARLLDVVVPEAGVPTGVALDVADAERAMLFPPVTGIVPDQAADRETADEMLREGP
ncbi:hypothetical protein [Streptomyces sp. JJ38]|uniref:hypothetical protein n=1 Tax=Streptomyces sp. JJ38 TaxID=2738128 RepID=UPI0027DF08C1|nr:hypothetical protein [Streptomyces sp. JJ38]